MVGCKHLIRAFLALVAITSGICAGAADNPAKFRPLDRPAYALYAIIGNVPTTQPDIDQLARNFLLAQMGADRATIDRLHAVNPNFKALHYINGTYTRPADDLRLAESKYRHAFAMWAAGKLAIDIDAGARQAKLVDDKGRPAPLRPSTTPGDFSSVDPDKPSTRYYVTWVRIDDELLRLDGLDPSSALFTVTRGFDGTKPASHKAGARVFCPVYVGTKEDKGNYPGSPKEDMLRYVLDPGVKQGWTWQAEIALGHVKEGYDGVWMDITSSVFFNTAGMHGEHVIPWNFKTGKQYTPDEYRLGHEMKINFLQEYIKKATGRYPYLMANNFRGINYNDGEGGESLLLKPTLVKPRPIEGYCMENSIGSWENGALSISDEEKWRQKIGAIARSEQDGIAAYPIIGPAGAKAKFLEIDTPQRDHFERFGYASYLLAVEKNGKTAFGIPAAYRTPDAQSVSVKLNEQYFYPIGDPAESRKWTDLNGFKLPGKHTYARKFTGGIVLVNPSATEDKAIALGGSFYDPQAHATVNTVDVPSQTGRILLKLQEGQAK